MARKTRRLTFIVTALVALTTVVAARTTTGVLSLKDISVTVEISATAGAGAAISWKAR